MDLPKNINPQDLTFEKVWLMFQETDKKIEKVSEEIRQVALTVERTSAKVDRLAEIYGGFMNNVARTAESFYF